MANVYDIDANKLIEEAAKDLAKMDNLKSPEWAAFVKTGTSKDRPPARQDWWYVRAAAILRAIYRAKGPIGVQKLRMKYGSKKNRGHKPEHFYRAGGKIIRLIIQQLEKEGLVKKVEGDSVHKGRIITAKGSSFLDKICTKLYVPESKKKTDAAKTEKSDKPEKQEENKQPENE